MSWRGLDAGVIITCHSFTAPVTQAKRGKDDGPRKVGEWVSVAVISFVILCL